MMKTTEISKVLNDAVEKGLKVQFMYSNVNKKKISKRCVLPVETINGDVLVGIDISNKEYRRFAYSNIDEIEIII